MVTSLARPRPKSCDVFIAGAGVAGALLATLLAKRGVDVVVADPGAFPRHKVCGGCLNATALAALDRAGLGDLPRLLGGPRLYEVCLAHDGQTARLALPDGRAVSRWILDDTLVSAAENAGAVVLQETRATLERTTQCGATITLQHRDGNAHTLSARRAVAADGLAGTFLKTHPEFEPRIVRGARLGGGAILDPTSTLYRTGTIYMANARGGYVGVVEVERRRLDVAAAFDPAFVKRLGGLGDAAVAVLKSAGLPPISGLEHAAWKGVPQLTRRRMRVAGEAVFVLGDAAAYVEPFTGEGMGWGMSSAVALADLLPETLSRDWLPHDATNWTRDLQALLRTRRRRCRWLTLGLRRPWLAGLAIRLLQRSPRLAQRYVHSLNKPTLAP